MATIISGEEAAAANEPHSSQLHDGVTETGSGYAGPLAPTRDDGDDHAVADDTDPIDSRTTRRAATRRARLVTVSTWVRNIGALLILFAAWQLWGTGIAESHSQAALGAQFRAEVHRHHAPSGQLILQPANAQLPVPPEGSVMALLQIPKIGLGQFVVSGTNTDDLAMGPGHYSGTALPGQYGNVAIAGHRTTHGAPFNRLAELSRGDLIYLTDLAGQRLKYIVVAAPFAVSPSDVSLLDYVDDNRLTLTTCNPEFSASQRLIVVAGYAGPATTAHAGPVKPYKVETGGEAGWNGPLIPVVLVVSAVLILLGLTNRRWSRILGPGVRWLILVPIWAALLYGLFETLSNFLPASA